MLTELQRGGASPDSFDRWFRSRVVGRSLRRGFETAIELAESRGELPRYLRADALDSRGKKLGSTAVLDTASEKTASFDR